MCKKGDIVIDKNKLCHPRYIIKINNKYIEYACPDDNTGILEVFLNYFMKVDQIEIYTDIFREEDEMEDTIK